MLQNAMIQDDIGRHSDGDAVTIGFAVPRTLTVVEASKYSGFGQHAIRDVIAAGALKAIRIGRNVRIAVTELDRFIAEAGSKGIDLSEFRLQRRASWPSEPHARQRKRRTQNR